MLSIEVVLDDVFNDETQEFVTLKMIQLDFEHSLVSMSKWESFFKKAFLSSEEKTAEESAWYFNAMLLTPNVPPEVWGKLTKQDFEKLNDYIGDTKTATWFREDPNTKASQETITAEIIYYWMIALTIPFECQHWHLSRLIALIRVCNEKNSPPKKRSHADIAAERRALNEKRLAELNTTG